MGELTFLGEIVRRPSVWFLNWETSCFCVFVCLFFSQAALLMFNHLYLRCKKMGQKERNRKTYTRKQKKKRVWLFSYKNKSVSKGMDQSDRFRFLSLFPKTEQGSCHSFVVAFVLLSPNLFLVFPGAFRHTVSLINLMLLITPINSFSATFILKVQ